MKVYEIYVKTPAGSSTSLVHFHNHVLAIRELDVEETKIQDGKLKYKTTTNVLPLINKSIDLWTVCYTNKDEALLALLKIKVSEFSVAIRRGTGILVDISKLMYPLLTEYLSEYNKESDLIEYTVENYICDYRQVNNHSMFLFNSWLEKYPLSKKYINSINKKFCEFAKSL